MADNQHPDVQKIEKVGEQLYRVLCHLCTGESEDLLVGAGNGYEAQRKLCRRWDPATSGRKRNLLRAILNPERCKTFGRREASYRTAGRLGEEIRSSEVSIRDPGVVE
jgi:hypothetical protein